MYAPLHNARVPQSGIATLLLIVMFLINASMQAQTRPSDIKFRLAQSYERSGDFETAVQVLQEIVSQDSLNVIVNDALRRDLVQLKRYDDALRVVERMLRRSPNDISLMAEAGTIYTLKSDRDRAIEIWNKALATDPRNESAYRVIGGAMVQNRLFDQAIDVYSRARKVLNDPSLFAVDIGYLYGITLNYAAATKEFLMLLRMNPIQMAFVQSRIALFTSQTDALAVTTGVVEEAVAHEPGILAYRQLLAWLYLEGKQFEKAYTVYQKIDEITKAAGHEMQRFAERAAKEHAFLVAARAYDDIQRQYPKFDRIADVHFGYARALESAAEPESDTLKIFGKFPPFGTRPDTGTSRQLLSAIRAYEQVISEHPGSEVAAKALLRIGIIRQESYGDIEDARQEYEHLIERYSRYPVIISEGLFRLGDVHLILGDFSRATEEFQRLSSGNPINPELANRSILRLAELDYYNARFDDALAKLKSLETNLMSDVANDALSLQIFIQGNRKPNDSALTRFASAELLRRQNRFSEAVTLLESIPASFPASDIIDETIALIGDIYAAMNKYPQAISAYDRLLNDFPESIEGDRTLMKKGAVYQFGLHDRTKATEAYETLLAKYPNSIYSGEARKRIRILRGESI